jgi:TetR/AcrR family transcriptional regulator
MKSKRKTDPVRGTVKLNDSAVQLIEATASLLSKRSDLNVSLSDIAQHSGLNSALIKYYFKNKEGLLLALLEHDASKHMEGLTRLVEMDASAKQKLSLHIRAVFRAYFHSPYLNRLIHYMEQHAEPSLGARVTQIFVKPIHAAYKAILAQGIREGVFRSIDPGLLYFSLIGTCDHMSVNNQSVEALTGHAKMTKKQMETNLAHVTEMILRGIAADGAPTPKLQSRVRRSA